MIRDTEFTGIPATAADETDGAMPPSAPLDMPRQILERSRPVDRGFFSILDFSRLFARNV